MSDDSNLDDRLFWLLKNNGIDPLGDFAGDLKHLIQEYIGYSIYLTSDSADGFEAFMWGRRRD